MPAPGLVTTVLDVGSLTHDCVSVDVLDGVVVITLDLQYVPESAWNITFHNPSSGSRGVLDVYSTKR